jgi:heme/copper-type cytochrome/quinol oxidase subunit 3
MVWQEWNLRQRRVWLTWIAATNGVLANAVALYCVWHAFSTQGVRPDESAYASIVFALFGFQWLVVLAVLVMQAATVLWALVAPADPRGHGVAGNAALVAWFSAASWLVVAATVYLAPLLW